MNRGIEYLHDQCKPRVIHRDLKTANILLDANFNAKASYIVDMVYYAEIG